MFFNLFLFLKQNMVAVEEESALAKKSTLPNRKKSAASDGVSLRFRLELMILFFSHILT